MDRGVQASRPLYLALLDLPLFSWLPKLKPFNFPLFLPLSTILEPTPPALFSSLFRIPLLPPILQDPRAVPLLKITMGVYKQEKKYCTPEI